MKHFRVAFVSEQGVKMTLPELWAITISNANAAVQEAEEPVKYPEHKTKDVSTNPMRHFIVKQTNSNFIEVRPSIVSSERYIRLSSSSTGCCSLYLLTHRRHRYAQRTILRRNPLRSIVDRTVTERLADTFIRSGCELDASTAAHEWHR